MPLVPLSFEEFELKNRRRQQETFSQEFTSTNTHGALQTTLQPRTIPPTQNIYNEVPAILRPAPGRDFLGKSHVNVGLAQRREIYRPHAFWGIRRLKGRRVRRCSVHSSGGGQHPTVTAQLDQLRLAEARRLQRVATKAIVGEYALQLFHDAHGWSS